MKTQKIKEKTIPELRALLQDERNKVRELRFLLTSGKAKNHREIRVRKRNIAQILTRLQSTTSAHNAQ